jgi:hypothetical protein
MDTMIASNRRLAFVLMVFSIGVTGKCGAKVNAPNAGH